MAAFEAELTTAFAKVAAQGERIKNTFDKMNAGNLRAVRDYVATLKKAEQLKTQQFAAQFSQTLREGATDRGLSSASAVARMNAAIDAAQVAAFRRAGAATPAGIAGGRAGSGPGGSRAGGGRGINLGEGPIGRFANRALEAAGFDAGSVPGIGVASAGALVAVKALLSIDAQRVAMAKQIVQLEQQRLTSIRDAENQQRENAKAVGERLGQKIETLVARGGSVGDAKDIAMQDGRDLSDVIDALIAVRNLRGVDPRQAIAIARRTAATGEVSMAEAVGQMQESPGLRFAAQQPGILGEINTSARIIAQKRGNLVPSADDLARIQLEMAAGQGQYGPNRNDQLLNNVRQQRRLRTQTELAGLGDVEQGLGVAGAQAELSTTVNRVASAMVEFNKNQEAIRTQLEASAKAQGLFAAGVQNFLMIIGGEGSEEQKRRRFDNARAAALFGTPNAPGR